jgi:hypothetical protein
LSWILSPSAYSKWLTTPRVTGYPRYLIEDDKAVDAPVFITNNLSATNQCVFIRASDCLIGLWGIDLVSDSFSMIDQNVIVLTINVLFDFSVLRGLAVVRSSDSAAQ